MSRALAAIAYIPVLHAGHLQLFERLRSRTSLLFVVGPELIDELTDLHPEIRALQPQLIARLVSEIGPFSEVEMLGPDDLADLVTWPLIVVKDSLTTELVSRYLGLASVEWETAFLRWDDQNVDRAEVTDFAQRTSSPQHQQFIKEAASYADLSSDWWRHVGAVVVDQGKVILGSYNHHLPSEHIPYIEGDPRDFVAAGVDSHLATAIHAEQAIIAQAAREGIALAGRDLYVTLFPCPMCAKLVAETGFAHCYFAYGHASMAGQRLLESAGVKPVLVEMK